MQRQGVVPAPGLPPDHQIERRRRPPAAAARHHPLAASYAPNRPQRALMSADNVSGGRRQCRVCAALQGRCRRPPSLRPTATPGRRLSPGASQQTMTNDGMAVARGPLVGQLGWCSQKLGLCERMVVAQTARPAATRGRRTTEFGRVRSQVWDETSPTAAYPAGRQQWLSSLLYPGAYRRPRRPRCPVLIPARHATERATQSLSGGRCHRRPARQIDYTARIYGPISARTSK